MVDALLARPIVLHDRALNGVLGNASLRPAREPRGLAVAVQPNLEAEALPDWQPAASEKAGDNPPAQSSDDAEIVRLAKLSPLAYDRERKAAAKRFYLRSRGAAKPRGRRQRSDGSARPARSGRTRGPMHRSL